MNYPPSYPHNSQRLSVIVIVRNEEKDLEACLSSVAGLASEIVVVDSGSTDRTLEIARQFTNRIFSRDWEGFSSQKQYALEQASEPWVLNIDADERVSPQLKDEIQAVLNGDTAVDGFEIPFHHYFLGRRLRFGGIQGEKHLRLFRRDKTAYGKEPVHEGVRVNGPVGQLNAPIEHHSYRDIEEYLEKCNTYTTMIAREKKKRGQRFHLYHHLRLPLTFVWRYVFQLGFLDGERGLTYALLSSYYVWLKFMKLRETE